MSKAGSERIAYKILTADQMAALLNDAFDGAPIDQADGYVHLSTADQLTATADLHFASQRDLHVAAVALDRPSGLIRWEASRGGALFPHLYGRLRLSDIIAHALLARDDDGRVRLPA